MVPFAGWEMPVSYKSIIEEHTAVRNSAGIFDIGHMGLIKVEGDAALSFIQSVATNDASKLSVNECQYSVLCNDAGGAIDDILVYRLPMLYMIVCNASNNDKVLAWLGERAKAFKQAAVSPYENYCMLSLQGPGAKERAVKTLNVPLSDLPRNHLFWWKDIIISRTGYTGEDGLEFIVHKNEALKLWEGFIRAGVPPCGLGARDTLRLEAGLPLYGHEYDEKTSPLEAGYGWAVKLDKGGFVGKAALKEQKEHGPVKKLVGLAPEGRAIPREGFPVFDASGQEEIGKVTSGTFSPTLKKPIALAYLAARFAETGKLAAIDIRGNKTAAKIVAKTFYKR